MATLPLYQPTGYLPADVPRLDYANLKEQAAQLNTITSALDRVSTFAFKKAGEEAERAGMQWAAENQPTAEQVLAAQEQGKSIQELFAQPGTIFGDAARKIQAGQLRAELEVAGRKKLADLSALIQSGSYNLADIQKEITGLTNGYSKAIAALSPEESLRFRASMGTAGNAVYTKATDRAAQIYSEGIKSSADDLIATSPTIIADTFASESDPKMILDRINVESARVFDIAAKTNDPAFVKEKMDDFRRQLLNSIVDYAVSPDFAQTPSLGLKRIMNNDFGKLSEVSKIVNKDKLLKSFMDRTGEIAITWKRTSELNMSAKIDEVNDIKDQMYSDQISGSVAYSRIKSLGVTLPDAERKSMLDGDNAGANAMMYGQFESLADRQIVGENYFDDLANAKVISWKQANTLKKIVRNDNPEMSRARQLIQNTLGIPDLTVQGFGMEKQTVANLNARLLQAQTTAKANGEAFNPMDFAQELIKSKEADLVIQKQKSKSDRIARKFEKQRVAYDPTRTYTTDDLNRLGFNRSEAESILRIQKSE